jgi:hypothetical protein
MRTGVVAVASTPIEGNPQRSEGAAAQTWSSSVMGMFRLRRLAPSLRSVAPNRDTEIDNRDTDRDTVHAPDGVPTSTDDVTGHITSDVTGPRNDATIATTTRLPGHPSGSSDDRPGPVGFLCGTGVHVV